MNPMHWQSIALIPYWCPLTMNSQFPLCWTCVKWLFFWRQPLERQQILDSVHQINQGSFIPRFIYSLSFRFARVSSVLFIRLRIQELDVFCCTVCCAISTWKHWAWSQWLQHFFACCLARGWSRWGKQRSLWTSAIAYLTFVFFYSSAPSLTSPSQTL